MQKTKTGTYTVTADDDSLDGWTSGLLAVALQPRLAPLGIEVEHYPTVSGGEGLTLAEEDATLREQVQQITEEVVVGGPAAALCGLLAQANDQPVRAEDLPEPVRSWYLRTDHYSEDAEGYVYDPEQQERPEWGDVVEQYLYDLGVEL